MLGDASAIDADLQRILNTCDIVIGITRPEEGSDERFMIVKGRNQTTKIELSTGKTLSSSYRAMVVVPVPLNNIDVTVDLSDALPPFGLCEGCGAPLNANKRCNLCDES